MISGLRLTKTMDPYAKLLFPLGHASRLAILFALSHSMERTNTLAAILNIKENKLIHHLKLLEKEGWIKRTQIGTRPYYQINISAAKKLKRFLIHTPILTEFAIIDTPEKSS